MDCNSVFLLAIVLFLAGKRISDGTWKRIVDVATILATLIGVWVLVDRSPDSNSTPTATLPITSTFFPTPSASASFDTIPVVTENPTATKAVPTKTLISTATFKSEGVLYQADWSEGMNGWVGSPDWKTVSGMLVNDGTGEFPVSGIVFPPFKPDDITDYAVESEIQVVSGRDGSCAAHYGFIVRGQEEQAKLAGFLIADVNVFCTGQGFMTISPWASPTPPYNLTGLNSIAPIDDGKWHKYRIEVKGNTIRLLIDGIPSLEVTDNLYLDGGFVALWSGNATLNVRSFKIVEN